MSDEVFEEEEFEEEYLDDDDDDGELFDENGNPIEPDEELEEDSDEEELEEDSDEEELEEDSDEEELEEDSDEGELEEDSDEELEEDSDEELEEDSDEEELEEDSDEEELEEDSEEEDSDGEFEEVSDDEELEEGSDDATPFDSEYIDPQEGDKPDETNTRRDKGAGDDISRILSIDEDEFTLERKRISLNSVCTSIPKKNSRRQSHKGLTGIVRELGILTPIHVMVTETYQDAIDEGRGDDFVGAKYLLLDGFRRLYSSYANKIEDVEAIVWQFKDPERGAEIALVLSLILSKTQKRTWEETWNTYTVLEMQTAMTPAAIEYLLELESGQAMKLKDIALATNYPEVWGDLVDKKKTLDQAYNQLQKLRREEDRYDIEDKQGATGLGEAGDIAGDATEGTGQLSEAEVREALELNDDDLKFTGDGDSEDEDGMFGEVQGDLQSTKERKPLDPVLRAQVLARDEFSCQCCGLGAGVSSTIAAQSFQIHHVVSVYIGSDASRDDAGMIYEGSDVPKLLTVCAACHSLIHLLVGANGKMGITKEEFEELPDHEQDRWKNLSKYAKVLLAAEKKAGKHLKQVAPRKLPNVPFWEAQKTNLEALDVAETIAERGNREY